MTALHRRSSGLASATARLFAALAVGSLTFTTVASAEGAPIEPIVRSQNANPACAPKQTVQGVHVYVAFTSTTTCDWTVPSGVTAVDYVVVAGGGGGGSRAAGGGGAGGFLTATNRSVSGIATLTIAVGAGGAGGAAGQNSGADGGASSITGTGFTTVSAVGGGGGGITGRNGGSGGGSSGGSTVGTANTVGTGTAGQGNNGGGGRNGNCAGTTSKWCGGGGGGAGAVGGGGVLNGASGTGGVGQAVSWISTSTATALSVGHQSGGLVYFAGGGGGGADAGGTAGAGGLGGGGAGSVSYTAPGFDARANTGGGGGGSGYNDPQSSLAGGNGGSGVVVIRYSSVSTTCTGTTSFSENSYIVVAFPTVQTNCTWTVPAGVSNIDYLVVAGGGGGGIRHAGGGGAGGLLTGSNTSVTAGSALTITVGAGGASATNGSPSSLTHLGTTIASAVGGGTQGTSGGSGGGSNWESSAAGTGTAGQGNNGGLGMSSVCGGTSSGWCGGGGGGAGAVGQAGDAGNNNKAGNGGIGLTTSLFSVTAAQFMGVGQVSGGAVYFAGGGGGGADTGGTAGTGGLGGGGTGIAGSSGTPVAALATTGGGGGGGGYDNVAGNSASGAGGSGVVVIRYTPSAADGVIDSSPLLNGSNQYFEVAEGTAFVSRATYTAETWINPTSVTCASICPVFSHDGDYTLVILNNKLTAYIYHTNAGLYDIWNTNITIKASEWQHVALVRDGSAARIFVNGQLRESRTLGGSTRSTYTNQFVLWLGRHYTNYYSGRIDHFRLWSTARTAADIAAGMHQHTPPVTTGLVAQYDFNGVSTSTVNNTAPSPASGTNLTAYGTPTYRDVKSMSYVGSDVVTSFPRSYLTSTGGWTVPDGISNVRAVVVAGGGGGGSAFDSVAAGGGGAGGLVDVFTSGTVQFTASTVRVSVGAGGVGGGPNATGVARTEWQVAGNDGQNSVLDSLIAVGGGGGSQRGGNGRTGGSGGGAGGRFAVSTAGTATAGQGNAGGRASADFSHGPGGGGANGAGGNSSTTVIGAGGSGRALSISGSSVTYAAGGSGGDRLSATTTATSGTVNTGGGGFGGNGVATGTVGGYGGDGGSGIVIVRYTVASALCAPTSARNGAYVVVRFEIVGECTWDVPAGVTALDYLVVGGGGGGGAYQAGSNGGGGGAGGVLDGTALAVTPTQPLTIDVGGGGAGGLRSTDGGGTHGTVGQDSALIGAGISTITASGGGYGGGAEPDYNGGPGGSGGGALGSMVTSGNGGIGVAGPPRQGFNGGNNITTCGANRPAGGGGGASAAGANASCINSSSGAQSGAGGAGRAVSITGSSVVYGGGGGGGGFGTAFTSAAPGAGGSGGGGAGGGILGANGVDGLGGGGGGAGYDTTVNVNVTGGDGGDGVVIVRYADRIVTKVEGDSQSGNGNSAASVNPKVRVVDAAGNGIDGIAVSFTPGANSGTVGSSSVTTSGGGYASTSWTFGSGTSQTVDATMSGLNGSNTVTFSATVTVSQSISYDANGGSGAPVQATANVNSTATVSSTVPTRTGYTFSSWNTLANGSGTSYASGATFTMPANAVTLYAQWTINSYSVTYDANGGTGAPATASSDFGSTVTISATRPTRTGYAFGGWNTLANGSGTSYAWNGSVFTPSSFTLGSSAVTLYAQWTINSYNVAYDANGGTGAPNSSSVNFNATVTVSSTVPTRTGYTFGGWNTAANGSGTSYASSATFSMPANAVTLYAQWTINSYSVIYDANGGSGAPGTSSVNYGSTVTISGTRPTRTGYSFTGWNTLANGSGTSYAWNGTVFSPASFVLADSNTTLFAQWTINSYNVAYDANGGTGAPNSSSVNFNASVTVSSTVPTRTGYTFGGWNTAANGSGTSYASSATFSMPANAVTLYAQWTINSYNVAYDANGGSGAPGTSSVNYGSTVTISGTLPTRTGYTFGGWNTAANGSGTSYAWNGTVFSPSSFVLADSNITLYAQWTINSYNVAYDANGGTGVPNSSSVNFNATVTVSSTVPTRTGYTFGGWNTAANGSGTSYASSATFSMPANAVTLYAQWTINSYSVAYDANGGTGAPNSSSVNYNATVTVSSTVPTRTGYTFGGWSTAANGSGTSYASSATFTMPASAVTLYAQWTINSYTVAYDANGGSGAPNSQSASFGSTVTISATVPTRTGYTFGGWNTAANGSGTSYASSATFTMPASAVTLYAQWTINSYTVAYDANGGSGAPNSQSVNFNATVTVSSTVPTRTGYTFGGWNTSANGSGTSYASSATFSMPASAVTLYAQWTINSYSVIYDANGGSGAPGTSSVNYGATITISGTRPTRTGYTFGGWNTAANGSGTSYAWNGTAFSPASFVLADANTTLYAQWTINSYTVTYDANGGSGAPNSQSANYNASITVSSTVPTRTGYTFDGWNTAANGSGTSIAGGSTYTVLSGVTLYAQWTINSYNVAYDANGGSGAPGTTSINYGATVTISGTRPTRTGYTFNGWNTAANGSGTSYAWNGTAFSPASFTLGANAVTLYAQWTINSYTVTYDANGGSGAPNSQTTNYNTSVTVSSTAPTRSGYTFAGWNTAANGSGSDYSSNTSLLVTNNVTLFAKWTINSYSISYDANGGSGAPSTASGIQFGSSTNVSSTVPTRSGYLFAGWNTALNGSGTSYSANAAITMPANNISLYAQWTATVQTITYNANGGTGAPSVVSVATNATATVSSSVPVRSGYTFLRWNTAANGSGNDYSSGATFTMGTNSLTLYAVWLANTYSVTYDANGGAAAPASSNVQTDATFTVSASLPTRAGYTLTSWNTARNGSGTHYQPSATFSMPANSVTLYAQWSANANNITYNVNGGSNAPANSVATTDSTTSISSAVPSRSGYTFTGWNTAANGSGTSYASGATFTMPTTHLTLFAQWTPTTFQVTYNANGGTGAPTSSSGAYLSNITLSSVAPTLAGYTFLGWGTLANGNGTNYAAGGSFSVPAQNTTLYAVWVADINDVYYIMNGGSNGPSSVPAATNSTVNIPGLTPTRTGYTFTGWNTAANGSGTSYAWNGSAFSPSTFTMPPSDIFFYAQWTINSYTITYNVNGGTGSTPNSQTGQYSSSQTIATPSLTRSGWTFVGWNTAADGSGTQFAPGGSMTLGASSLTLYAEWNRNVNAVIFDALGGVSAPAVTFGATGATIVLPSVVPQREGHTFLRWEDSTQTAHNPGATFTMPVASITLYAKWSVNSYAFAYDANGGSGTLPTAQNIDFSSSVTVTNAQVTRPGFTFSRWNTAADGSGTSYDPSASFQMPARAVTLYAQWNVVVTTTTSTTTIPVTPATVVKKPTTPRPIAVPTTTTTTTTTITPTTTTTTVPAVDDTNQSGSDNTWIWWATGIAVLSLGALTLTRRLKKTL